MSLVAVFARNRARRSEISSSLEGIHHVAVARSWTGFQRLVRERPVTVGVVNLEDLGSGSAVATSLLRFRSSFPGLGLVVLVRRDGDPGLLFRLGTVGIQHLVLVDVEGVERGLIRSVPRALERGVVALVTRSVTSYVPPRELKAVRLALDSVHRRWSADDFADAVGLSRPFLSECFKTWGLPSVGTLLLWTRLLHAGYWLTDPGRTGESVSRQLEYCDGSAFRRALRTRTGATPTEVAEAGGLRFVLGHFLEACDFDSEIARRFSAA